jgi:hypothetical protein
MKVLETICAACYNFSRIKAPQWYAVQGSDTTKMP